MVWDVLVVECRIVGPKHLYYTFLLKNLNQGNSRFSQLFLDPVAVLVLVVDRVFHRIQINYNSVKSYQYLRLVLFDLNFTILRLLIS